MPPELTDNGQLTETRNAAHKGIVEARSRTRQRPARSGTPAGAGVSGSGCVRGLPDPGPLIQVVCETDAAAAEHAELAADAGDLVDGPR